MLNFLGCELADAQTDFNLFAGAIQQYVFISTAMVYAKPHRQLSIAESAPLGNTFSEYARHLGLPKFLAALKANDATIFRVSTSPIAQLYNTLCGAGLDGRPLSSVMNVNEAGPKPYLIPLAYADFFTSYRSQTKADYASIFEGMLPHEWVDLYWDGYKDAVRAAAPFDATHPPRFDQLTDIAIALGVNRSERE